MKRIFLSHWSGGAYGYISTGWLNALQDRGFDVQRWDGDLVSWQSFAPQLYIGSSGHRQPIPNDTQCKIAMHVNPFGPIDCGSINESQDAIEYIKHLQPNAVFGYGFNDDKTYWQYWTTQLNIPWAPMPTAADAVLFNRIKPSDQRTTDVIYVGGRWPYKAKSIDAYLLPMMHSMRQNNKSVKIYGWGDWPADCDRNVILDHNVANAFNDTKIGACISEPHTHKWGFDLPERIWKVVACGCLPIHDPVPTLRRELPSLPMAKDPLEYTELHAYYLANNDDRMRLADELYHTVMRAHTYHHRLAGLFNTIGWHDEAAHLIA